MSSAGNVQLTAGKLQLSAHVSPYFYNPRRPWVWLVTAR